MGAASCLETLGELEENWSWSSGVERDGSQAASGAAQKCITSLCCFVVQSPTRRVCSCLGPLQQPLHTCNGSAQVVVCGLWPGLPVCPTGLQVLSEMVKPCPGLEQLRY